MSLLLLLTAGAQSAALSVSGIIIPECSTEEGILIKSTSLVWTEIVEVLGNDWSVAYQIPAEKWEEIVAGAFNKAQYEVTLTPRSGDHELWAKVGDGMKG
jgi:restriction system protein